MMTVRAAQENGGPPKIQPLPAATAAPTARSKLKRSSGEVNVSCAVSVVSGGCDLFGRTSFLGMLRCDWSHANKNANSIKIAPPSRKPPAAGLAMAGPLRFAGELTNG